MTVDELTQIIRAVDETHSLGAAELSEHIIEYMDEQNSIVERNKDCVVSAMDLMQLVEENMLRILDRGKVKSITKKKMIIFMKKAINDLEKLEVD